MISLKSTSGLTDIFLCTYGVVGNEIKRGMVILKFLLFCVCNPLKASLKRHVLQQCLITESQYKSKANDKHDRL